MAESPEEKEALAKLDEATREVAWAEEDKEADREFNTRGIFAGFMGGLARFGRPRRFQRVKGDPELEPVDDQDPGDEHGLRDALDDDHAQN
ncbi:MAG TPA: hypothetical protein VKB43_01290 [Gaiellaceae bacterium]|nr:hypothetical protein [Gaiellaceae bacterium]